jgi:dTDP-4-dehydrorhamnose reductase
MRILVTGVTGQVGGALAGALQPLGTVIATERSDFDLAKPDLLPGRLDQLAPDVIVNPAAYTAVDQAEDDIALAMLVNARAPAVLAQWAAKHDAPLIHFSTDYVFSGEGARAWSEGDATAPLSAYGMSKLAGEDEIRAAGGCFLILRTSWVYAARGKNFLRTIARFAREREELRIVADQIGAPTSARRLADVVAAVLANGLDNLRARSGRAQGLLHVSACGEASWHQFATAIVDGLRARGVKLPVSRIVPIRTEDYPTRAQRPRNSRLDLRRLREVFGIETPPWAFDLAPELDLLAQELGEAGIDQR